MQEQLTQYIRAGFAGLYLVTPEEVHAESEIKKAAENLGYSLFSWTITGGLADLSTQSTHEVYDPAEAASAIAELPENSILVLKDYHQFLGNDTEPASPQITRTLKENIRHARISGKVVLITGCCRQIPPELEKELTVIESSLPDQSSLRSTADGIAESAGINADDEVLDQAAEAARGLTAAEAEDIMALSIVRQGTLDADLIGREKANAVAGSGMLEIIDPRETADDIGGLENLKSWLSKRRNAFGQDARDFGLPLPKGVLILGIPGTGKSLTAKAASGILSRPILRLDAGKIFAGIVGRSEANLRNALQVAEAVSPCILWIDEIEKGMSGSQSSGSTDGGTGARVFGSFLSWMQEKTSSVFTVATANDVQQLPPELLRRGRFDELFFVDLPEENERRDIWRIHLEKRQRTADEFDLDTLAQHSDGFTGSEIEQAVVDALYDAFEDGGDLNDQLLQSALEKAVPLSVTMAEQVRALRKWAADRARPAGNTKIHQQNGNGRKLWL